MRGLAMGWEVGEYFGINKNINALGDVGSYVQSA